MTSLTVLIPTYQRVTALAVTLTSLVGQSFQNFEIVISEQNRETVFEDASIKTVLRVLGLEHEVTLMTTPPLGMAHHRQALLDAAMTKYVLYLDDDLMLGTAVLKNMMNAIQHHSCGFVGMAPIGLSYMSDMRLNEHDIEFWEDDVTPETVSMDSPEWQRYILHNAANIWHVSQKLGLTKDAYKLYKVAWIGGCVLYERQKLIDVGGFQFWKDLPKEHAGEDVMAQLRVMAKYGGCGVIPSYVFHQEIESTVSNRIIDAPKYLL